MAEFALKHKNGVLTDYELWKELLDADELPNVKDVKKVSDKKVKK